MLRTKAALRQSIVPIAVLFFLALTGNSSKAYGQLSTGTVPATLCACNNVTVGYTVDPTAVLASSNDFDIQLSDASGSFTSPVTLGTVSNSTISGSLSVQIPCNTAGGTGYRIRVVSNNTAYVGTDNGTDIEIMRPPTVTSHPIATRNSCDGSNTTFSVAATGSNLAYQWQVNTGSTWSNVTGTMYSGITTNTLTITAATAMSGYMYRCIISNTACTQAISNTGTLVVNTPPTITTDPVSSRTICEGAVTTLSVAATGANLSYNWETNNGGPTWSSVSGAAFSGSNTNTLTITAPASIDGHIFRCVVSNPGCAAKTSRASTINVQTAPSISSQPQSLTMCAGNNTSFSVTASGTAISYQWEVYNGTTWANANGGIYSGSTTNKLDLTSVTASENGYQYRCVISSPTCATLVSNTATISVNTAAAVTTEPQVSRVICVGNNTTFNVTATGTNLSYKWETNNGTLAWSAASGGVYSGENTNTLTITGATASMDGYLYRCVITNTSCPVKVSRQGTLTVQSPAVIAEQPEATRIICDGNNTTFSIKATGTISYQWEVYNGTTWSNANGGIYSGSTTNTLNIASVSLSEQGYQYRCIVTSPCGSAITSQSGTLTVETPPAFTTHPTSPITCVGGNASLSVVATGTSQYQWEGSGNNSTWFALTNNANHSGVNSTTLSLSNVSNSTTYRYYRCVATGAGSCQPVPSNSVPVTLRTTAVIINSPIDVDVCVGKSARFTVTASGDLLNYKWQLSTNGGNTWNFLSEAGVYSGTNTSVLNVASIPLSMHNYKYRCVVSGFCPATVTTTAATLTVSSYVAITSQPIKTDTICSGGNINISVGATGSGLTYEWYLNKGNGDPLVQLTDDATYTGTNTPNLIGTGISVTGKTHTYSYSCIVRGICSSVRADITNVTVYADPVVRLEPLTADKCDKTHRVQFGIKADGTDITYQWEESTDGGTTWNALANAGNYSFVNTNTMEIYQVSTNMNDYQYRCIVAGICNVSDTSNPARLVVNPLLEPEVTIVASSNDFCAGESITFTPTPTVGGSNPTYQWRINGVNTATGATFTTSALANNDFVSCIMTSNAVCKTKTTALSNYSYVKVTPLTPASVAIVSNVGTSWCTGKEAIFTATPTNGGNTPIYEWTINGNPSGVTTPQFTTMLNNGDEVQALMTSSIRCASPAVAGSNKMKMTINPTTSASVLISPNPDSVICVGDEVTVFVAFTNGGSVPKFQWMLNGVDMQGETNATLKTSKLKQHDEVNCRLISSNICVFPEVSNSITFDVNTRLKPEVQIQSSYIGNNAYTFTASAINEGSNPTYIWFRNGAMQAGLTGPVQTFENMTSVERIYVQLASSEACIVKGMESVSSNVITTTSVSTTATILEEIKLHPNPNNGQFTISGNLAQTLVAEDVTLYVFNAVGQKVHEQTQRVSGNELKMPIALQHALPAGMYTASIIINNEATQIRFIVNK